MQCKVRREVNSLSYDFHRHKIKENTENQVLIARTRVYKKYFDIDNESLIARIVWVLSMIEMLYLIKRRSYHSKIE